MQVGISKCLRKIVDSEFRNDHDNFFSVIVFTVIYSISSQNMSLKRRRDQIKCNYYNNTMR